MGDAARNAGGASPISASAMRIDCFIGTTSG
jgi:hypothetical protein